jgi:hypothetical protein
MTCVALRCPHDHRKQNVTRGTVRIGIQHSLYQTTACARGSFLRDDRHHGYVPEVTPIIMDRRLNAIGVRETVRVLHLRTACATVSGRRGHAMHVGVIGGTGHISTSIVRVLLAQGHAVTWVNRGLRGEVAPGARLVRGDRRVRAAFERTLQAERCDAVAYLSPADNVSRPLPYRLRRLHQPVMSSPNWFSIPRSPLLSSI